MGEKKSQIWAQPRGTGKPQDRDCSHKQHEEVKWKQERQQGRKGWFSKLQIVQNYNKEKHLSLQDTLVVTKSGLRW